MCKYCKRDEYDGYTLHGLPHHEHDKYGESILVVYEDGLVDLWVCDGDVITRTEEFQFNFCPMCGRKLVDKLDEV